MLKFKLALTALLLLGMGGCQFLERINARSQPPPPSPTPVPAYVIQPGDGSDLMDRLLESGVIRVGIRVWPEAEFSPPAFRGFSNAVTGGALNGFEVDVARWLAEGLGLELELVQAYPPAIAGGEWRGQWDVAIASLVPFDEPAAPAAERTPLYFSRPYAYMPMGLLVPAAQSGLTLPQLESRRIAVLEYSAYQSLLAAGDRPLTVQANPVLKEFPANVRPVPVSNLIKAIHQLSGDAGTAPPFDAIFGPAPIFTQAIEAGLPVALPSGSERLGRQPLAVAAIRQDGLQVDRLLAEINRVLALLEREGILAETSLKWYGEDITRSPERGQ